MANNQRCYKTKNRILPLYFKFCINLLCACELLSVCLPSMANKVQMDSDKINSHKEHQSISIASKLCSSIDILQDNTRKSKEVCNKAIESTVKIRGLSDISQDKPQGSGVIVKKILENSNKLQTEKYKYYVLTNRNVLVDIKKDLFIITSDRKSHPVKISDGNFQNSKRFDLSVVYFISTKDYQVLPLPQEKFLNSNLDGRESKIDIFVVGYPACKEINCQEAKFTQGKYGPRRTLVGNNSLEQGYSIPYNNETERGMSGSPILNENGLLIGIHGKGKYGGKSSQPGTPDTYLLDSKTSLSPETEEMMKYFSWGIPIELANDLIPSDIPTKLVNQEPPQDTSTLNFPEGKNVLDIVWKILLATSCLIVVFYTYQHIKKKLKKDTGNTFPLPIFLSTESSENLRNQKILRLIKEKNEQLKDVYTDLQNLISHLEKNK
jgi:S1-C subfamily serine protease